MLIRIVAAGLLLLGSGLIFRALLAIDALSERATDRPPRPQETDSAVRRAA